ncbi:MAG: tRNA (adenine-N1)-methyltransferase [Thermoplasmata archaeon]|nr:MAG: tRNA (adenine-N1)-methyltransferase [Thermoplasmata archaeon]
MTFDMGDTLVLVDRKGGRHLVRLTGGKERVGKVGVIDTSALAGLEDGARVQVGSAEFTVLTPTVMDKVAAIERRAQIVVPTDAALIALHADVKAGDLVVEGGAGSGALSIVLLHLLRPGGRLVTYELREDHAELAKANVERAGLSEGHDLRLGDVATDIAETGVDAVVLDVPEPWKAVAAGASALRAGGRLVSYSPTVGQVERTHEAARAEGLSQVRTFEVLERELVVGKGGTRPSFDMLGHTGYITVARKMKG